MNEAVPNRTRQTGGSPLLDLIVAKREDLRRSEQKVADTVLADPEFVVGASMAALAVAAKVSEPTVMRFCVAVGCQGFQAFKFELARSLAFGVPATHSVITTDDDVPSLVQKVFDYSISSLDHARRQLDAPAVAAAVEAIAGASDMIILGFGASGILGQDVAQKFPLFRVACNAPVDAHQQYIAASLAQPSSVVLAISNRARTAAVLDAAGVAKGNGATIIALSGETGPLTALADIAIITETLENTDFYTPTISRLAGLVLIDVLATGVALRHEPAYIEQLQVMKAGLVAMRRGRDAERAPRPPSGSGEGGDA